MTATATPTDASTNRHGRTRPMTPAETVALRVAAARVPASAPPWTADKLALFTARDRALLALFEDGVSVPTLADALAGILGRDAIHQRLRKARAQGYSTGARRYQSRPARVPARPALAADDAQALRAAYLAIPASATGQGRLRTGPACDAFRTALDRVLATGVPPAQVAAALGITREALRQRMLRA